MKLFLIKISGKLYLTKKQHSLKHPPREVAFVSYKMFLYQRAPSSPGKSNNTKNHVWLTIKVVIFVITSKRGIQFWELKKKFHWFQNFCLFYTFVCFSILAYVIWVLLQNQKKVSEIHNYHKTLPVPTLYRYPAWNFALKKIQINPKYE